MKEGSRFVDSDMHVVEPWGLFERYLDPAFKHRVTTSPKGGLRGLANFLIDSEPTNGELNTMQYNRVRDPLRFARSNTAVGFASDRGFDAEAQVMAMETEGIDIAVLFPTLGLSFVEKSGMDADLAHAVSRAYNDWLHDFCRHSPDQLKMAAMLPMQDVNLACQELLRCVEDYGAVGAFVHPRYMNGHYWHSKYWNPFYGLLQELNVPICFHGGTGMSVVPFDRYGENKALTQAAANPTEMQLTVLALVMGGIFEFYPKLRAGFLEAQSWWVPGLLERMDLILHEYKEADAPFLSLSPLEYWQRNCFSGIEGSERSLGGVVELVGADNLCVSTDFPHHDSNFPEVANTLLANPSVGREQASRILTGGARLYGFTDQDYVKADAAAAKRKQPAAAAGS
jgi:predicted TIM-barrel fold metal-dependent hydrolase